MTRLPVPGADDNQWGNILNDYLSQAHNSDGSLKPISDGNVSNSASIAQTKIANLVADLAGKQTAGNYITSLVGDVIAAGPGASSAALAAITTAGTVGSGSQIPVITYDAKGRITSSSTASPKSLLTYNVKDYGAIGDGTTNDTVAIQAALDAAYSAGGGIVFLPAATYIVDPNPGLQVKDNTTLRGTGAGSILKLKNGSTQNDNLVKSESHTNVAFDSFAIDGNRANQAGGPGAYTYTQYGLYIAGSSNVVVYNVTAHSTTGVGIHLYNNTGCRVLSCSSTNNNYHGYEYEQDTNCRLEASVGSNNLLHGVLVSPGEVGGTGSRGNSIVGSVFDGNGNYGIATNAANGDISAFLNDGTIFLSNSVTNNAYYGVNFYKQNGHIFNNNYVANNGYFGLYAFESSANSIQGNTFHNNSKAANGGYDEILLEGYTTDSSHPSANTIIAGNTILIDGLSKARHAISEASTGDGPNLIYGNIIPNAGTASKLNILNSSTLEYVDDQNAQLIKGAKEFGATITADQGLAVAPNASLAAGMGIDAPFGTAALRVYNGNSGGNLQLVAPNGTINHWAGGNDVMDIVANGVQVNSGYSLTAPKLNLGVGANASAGTGTLAGGTVTITTTAVTANSLIFLTTATASITNAGVLSVTAKSAGVSFTVTSTNSSDTAVFNWLIIN